MATHFPPSPPHLSSLRFGYDYSMDNRLYNQAIFYAERIIDEVKGKRDATPDIILHTNHLLAQALYHDHQIGRAYYTLQNALSSPATWTHPSRHLLALCCELLSRYEEGIRALVITYDNNTYIPEVIANGPAGAFLLGQLYEKNSQYELALPAYEKSLEAGPFMFAAYERIAYLKRRSLGQVLEQASDDSEWDPANCFSMDRLATWHALTDTATSVSPAATVIPIIETSNPKGRIEGRSLTEEQRSLRKPLKEEANVTLKPIHGVKDGEIPGRTDEISSSSSSSDEIMVENKSTELLSNILKNFGHLFEASTRLDLPKAQRIVTENMTSTQADSRYALLKLAEVTFDRGEYEEAEEIFCNMFTAYPFITDGVGKYSTLLWHQKRKRALVELSRRVLTYGRLRAESWICAANLDSLDLDHVEARMKLEKARLLNHRDANICCLIGHELSSIEQFDQAAYSYSQSLKLDPTSYAAWFGISQICRRQDRLDDCEYHVRKAIDMNPYHPVLKVALGSLLSSRGRADEALSVLDSVCDGNTATDGSLLNALYERSRILAHVGRIDDAIQDARKVVEALPTEAAGHALLGQLLARGGENNTEALTHLNLALERAGCGGIQGSTIKGGGGCDDGIRGILELINNLSSIGGIRKTLLETSNLQENRPPTFPVHQRLRFNSLSSTGAMDPPNRLSLSSSSHRRSEGGSDDQQQPQRMSLGSSTLDSVLEEEPDPLLPQGSTRQQQQQQSSGRVFRPADPFAPTFYRLSTADLPTDQRGPNNSALPATAAIHFPVTVQQQESPLAIPRPSRPPPPPSSSSVEDTQSGNA
ncbi:anaphase-promoting complex subunit cdc27 [Perkinsus chesapeaki]|uniref:Anaphase-promoting complex subunit cdc27 n=1 Tax=Perkinsus chesapeaki TaxID=330153 RepID=A0A7J6MSE4_PERCH|nr:anaphase-promoting complex subunit cdc27 [Perkinsus chesapeaki]